MSTLSVEPPLMTGGGFWDNKTLSERAQTDFLIRDDRGENAFDTARLEGAGYRLRMGGEAYISPVSEDARTSITQLGLGEPFMIPPGQFAFLLTEEVVHIPNDAIGFISLRSKAAKFRGLVNVSGFHADPGYVGKLVFSVFNAGPGDIHLRQGDELFAIMYADLRAPTGLPREKRGYMEITSDLIAPIAGRIQSLAGLKESLDEVEDRLDDRLHRLERDVAIARWAAALGVGALITILIRTFASG